MADCTRLKPLHSDSSLSRVKLVALEKLSTEELKQSLLRGGRDSLKVRPDGMILDGHHRIKVLRGRVVEVDSLPREIVAASPSVPDANRERREE